MEDEQMVEEILAAVEQLMQVAGPEAALEFIQGGIEELAGGGEEAMPEEEAMPAPGPSQPRDPMTTALMARR
jgi:hypothetical protein